TQNSGIGIRRYIQFNYRSRLAPLGSDMIPLTEPKHQSLGRIHRAGKHHAEEALQPSGLLSGLRLVRGNVLVAGHRTPCLRRFGRIPALEWTPPPHVRSDLGCQWVDQLKGPVSGKSRMGACTPQRAAAAVARQASTDAGTRAG